LGPSVANHLIVTETLGSEGSVRYAAQDVDGVSATGCSGVGTATLTCTLTSLRPGSNYHIFVVLRTPSGVSDVTDTLNYSFDSQTNGVSNRKSPAPVPASATLLPSDGSFTSSYAVEGDSLTTGGGQTSVIAMPAAFRNGQHFTDSTVRNGPATALCSKCPPWMTTLSIPASLTATNPFLDGTGSAPFQWTLTLPGASLPSGFKLTGIYHDGALIPACTYDLGGSPILGAGATNCVASLVQAPKTKTITAVGWGIQNGTYQFG
jgi:hypothetical protein